MLRRRVSGIALVEAAIARGELPAGTDAVMAHEIFIGPMLNRTFFFPEAMDAAELRKLVQVVIAGLKSVFGKPA